MLGANSMTKRKLPKHAQIYAYGSQDCSTFSCYSNE